MRRFKVPCQRFVVFECLKSADDFMTAAQISSKTGIGARAVTATLHNLRYCKAVQMVEARDALWWFATPEDDVRTKHIEERAVEDKPRATRKRKQRKPQ